MANRFTQMPIRADADSRHGMGVAGDTARARC